ncbi:MAG TPA: CDP-alcohol phosphatidyltransferase family protein [Xanthomonadales bacterium]|nr:CDP-alcohol phosphatidyltransferase family protein [Xanthomonadales bacterium]
MRLSWIPNAITVARLLMSAPLAWAILRDDPRFALALAVVAGTSDALDGLLARRFGWRSRLGGLLDPVADKLMLLACYVSLVAIGGAPAWLVWLVLGRDLVIVAGAVAYHNFIGRLDAEPSRISKLTTFLQIALAVALLAERLPSVAMPPWLHAALVWSTAAATLASGLHYVVVWTAKARRATRKEVA